MRCHYCGFRSQPPNRCEDCGSNNLDKEGYGTEKITEDLQKIMPEANIERFDQESTKRKKAHKNIIEGFDQGKIQILVGTQLLAKGFDFEKVDFVGVVNADHMLHFPDFRSGERTFQLLTQVAGRTGRRDRDGKVMLQSYRPDHPVIEAIITSDYNKLYETEICDRLELNYPPFSRLILLQVKDFDALTAERAAKVLAQQLKQYLGDRVVGPAKPGVSKINRWYIREILIRINKKSDQLNPIKVFITNTVATFYQDNTFKKTRVIINVDPQ
jgi:primosomal protein N' (replication factor Y)